MGELIPLNELFQLHEYRNNNSSFQFGLLVELQLSQLLDFSTD